MTAPAHANSLLDRADPAHHLVDIDSTGCPGPRPDVSSSPPPSRAPRPATATAPHGAAARPGPATPEVPAYLTEVYNWAYVSPEALDTFERQWLVNAILFGNYRRLRDAALDLLGDQLPGRTLQIACVYGDLTASIAARVPADGSSRLTVVDVLPQQLDNLHRKLAGTPGADRVEAVLGNSAALPLREASVDRALLFFLLHEQPEAVRRGTLAEAFRVLKPGGRLVLVDYHRAHAWHPLHLPMRGVLAKLEPFALDLWRQPIEHWLPPGVPVTCSHRKLVFGGLYQVMVFEKAAG